MSFPGTHPPFYFATGAFTSTSASQSASPLHAPPDLRPMSNPSLQQHHLSSSAHHPFPFGEQIHHQDFSHDIHLDMASFPFDEQLHHQDFSHDIHLDMASSPTMKPPPYTPLTPAAVTETVVKKKCERPRKYVPDNEVDLGLYTMPSSKKPKNSSSMCDPSEPKRARGRPPGTGRKQRIANLGTLMNDSAGLAFAPHVITVEAGEDIVSKILSISQQRPRALCIISGTGTVSSVTLLQPASSVPSLSFQGHYEILSLGGSYLVNQNGGPKSRTGGVCVSLSRPDGYFFGGGVGRLIAASLVQVVVCSFVYATAKAKAFNQENVSKEDKNNIETPTSELQPPPAIESAAEVEAPQTPSDFSGPALTTGWWQ